MSRRGGNYSVSPYKIAVDPAAPDERQVIIKRLKEQLILARGKQKEILILENYLNELIEKNKLVNEQIRKKQIQGKSKGEASQKLIAELKRQIQGLKNDLRNHNIELSQKENEHFELKRHLAKKATEIQKVRKQGLYLQADHEDLMLEHSKLMAQYEDISQELSRIESTNRHYEDRIAQIKNKIAEVSSYLGELNDENRILKQNLRKYEQDNNNICDDVNAQEDRIDDLERIFAEQHTEIKLQVDNYIQKQHYNEKTLTEIRHQLSLLKSENEKTTQLSTYISHVDKEIGMIDKQNENTKGQINQLKKVNGQYQSLNQKMVQDLNKCQIHLQNLLKHNAFIQQELQKYLREDQHIISIIRKKRALPGIAQFNQMRESRKNTVRTYV